MLNKYMEAQAPWKLAKTDMKAANRVLYTAAEGLRIATIMLAPVMPEKTAAVLDILGAAEYRACLGPIKTRHRFESPIRRYFHESKWRKPDGHRNHQMGQWECSHH